MSYTFEVRIRKGLDLKIRGEASLGQLTKTQSQSEFYALIPEDFNGVKPKLLVKIGDKVKAGDAVFCHKFYPAMQFVSPISGTIVEIKRGAKRKILSIEISPDVSDDDFKLFGPISDNPSAGEIKDRLLEGGMWGFIRQRPYDIIALPDVIPQNIFITANFTAPLAPNFLYLLNQEDNRVCFETALKALSLLTDGNVYINVKDTLGLNINDKIKEVVVKGPHPAGLVGTLINKVKPINQGQTVWTLKATDLFVIGRFLKNDKVDFHRTIAVTGPYASECGYINILPGGLLRKELGYAVSQKRDFHLRFIAGNVFTGKKLDESSPFSPLDIDQLTIIREGDDIEEPFGWIMPRFKQFSISRSYFSWLMPSKHYDLDARLKGGKRAMINSGEFSKVFPLNILPEQLLKATIAFNIDKMESLGIYEVAPEDFALCEFVDSSKQPLQKIIRDGLDMLYKEMN